MKKITNSKTLELKKIASLTRKLILQISHEAQVGHIGSALSIVEILTILYFAVLKVDPKKPHWRKRDRFILSKGHAASALYSILALKKFFSMETLFTYCKNNGLLGVHPEYHMPGVEFSTGSLGHGLPAGIGMALSAKLDKRTYKIFVLVSDAECNAGEIWQSALIANQHQLNNLIVIVDYNKVQALGTTKEVLDLEPFSSKWKAFGWNVFKIDGHKIEDLFLVFQRIPKNKKPTVIIANTIRGKGVSFMEHKIEWHYLTTNEQQYRKALEEIE